MSIEAAYPSLKNSFLLAMPGVSDPIFSHSIMLLCEHSKEGAMGIIINRPLDIRWYDIFEQFDIPARNSGNEHVLAGGPVQMDRGFVLHRSAEQQWDNSMVIDSDIVLTTSMDIISALAADKGPPNSLMALGYAGWGAAQLEEELARNLWLTMPADHQILFDVPLHQKAQAAASKLGINLDLLSAEAGHA